MMKINYILSYKNNISNSLMEKISIIYIDFGDFESAGRNYLILNIFHFSFFHENFFNLML